MSVSRPRIAILGIHLESNAFAPVSTEEDFRKSCYFEGEAMLAEAAQPAPAMPAEIPGFVEVMNATGPWEPLPIIITATEPGGPADQRFIDATFARMRTMLEAAGPLDAIYISNHGAMTSSGAEDPDGALYALARAAAGPAASGLGGPHLHPHNSPPPGGFAHPIPSPSPKPPPPPRPRGAVGPPLLRPLLSR